MKAPKWRFSFLRTSVICIFTKTFDCSMKQYGYPKTEKLKHKITLDALFKDGKAVTVFPLRLIYLPIEHRDGSQIKTGVSVSKRLHKTAVTRNKIKRQLREAYRLKRPKYFNKSSTPLALMILYLSKDTPDYELIESKMDKALAKLQVKLKETSNEN